MNNNRKGLAAGASNGGRVRVVITPDQIAVLEPPLPQLEPLLACESLGFEPGGATGYRAVARTEVFWSHDHRGRLAFPAGLLPRVVTHLEEDGIGVDVEDRRVYGRRFQVDEGLLDTGPEERALLNAAAGEPLGRIEVRGWRDTVEKCLLISRFYPRACIVIAVTTRRGAWKMWRELEDDVVDRVGLVFAGVRRRGRRCTVCTVSSLAAAATGRKADILVLPEAERSMGDAAAKDLGRTGFSRVYALVPPGRAADVRVQLRLEALAGPLIYRVAGKPTVPVRVLVVPVPTRGSMRAVDNDTPLKRKRQTYWHHAARNRTVANVALRLTNDDTKALCALGLKRRVAQRLARDTDRKVVILVESTEHAHKLLSLLPGWVLCDAVPKDAHGQDKNAKLDKTVKLATGTKPRCVIMTAVYAANHAVDADVLIRATGTPWPLNFKDFPPVQVDGERREVLMMDFDDSSDTRAAEDARRRLDGYRALGWTVEAT